jgi:tRNA nucleotidyltransferase/poly(A) polymerase
MSGREAPVLTRERAPWLGAGPLARLLMALDSDGEEARVVGGAVRNTLLGLPPGDVDVATTAQPEVVVRRAEAAGFHAVPTGIEHGTVTVVVNDVPFEVTTLRQDIETDGRHAVVRFGRDWRTDAERRDFTMNALFVQRDGKVIDFVGGLADIAARRVRFIGDPATRIAEDYLRVLRFFRFHAAYGAGAPDPAGLAACIRARDGLDQLSRERVRVEIMKLMIATRVSETVEVMTDAGVLVQILGGVPDLAGLRSMARNEQAIGLAPDAVRRLTVLAVRIVEDALRLRERLRLSNDEVRRMRAMSEKWWQIEPEMGPVARRAVLYRIGPENYRDRVLLAFARSRASADDAGWQELLALPEEWTAPKFRLEKGPLLGAALAIAEESWIVSGFPDEAMVLDAIAEWAIKQAREGVTPEKQ